MLLCTCIKYNTDHSFITPDPLESSRIKLDVRRCAHCARNCATVALLFNSAYVKQRKRLTSGKQAQLTGGNAGWWRLPDRVVQRHVQRHMHQLTEHEAGKGGKGAASGSASCARGSRSRHALARARAPVIRQAVREHQLSSGRMRFRQHHRPRRAARQRASCASPTRPSSAPTASVRASWRFGQRISYSDQYTRAQLAEALQLSVGTLGRYLRLYRTYQRGACRRRGSSGPTTSG